MHIIKWIVNSLQLFGIDLIKIKNNIIGLPRFIKTLNIYFNISKKNHDFPIKKIFPVLTDWHDSAGSVNSQYFLQDLFVAQLIFNANPDRHIDVGSRIDGFVSNVASFRKIEILDIRDLNKSIDNIHFTKADLMRVPVNLVESCDSISSLHALEHFGLGRYGDRIDLNGHIKGIESIYKILKNDGIFYLSVPIGLQRTEFNAHRVFSIKYLIDILSDRFRIISFSYINDDNNFFKYCELTEYNISNNFGCKYGCGIFVLQKKLVN